MAKVGANNMALGSAGLATAIEAMRGFCPFAVLAHIEGGLYMLECRADLDVTTTRYCCAHHREGCSSSIHAECKGNPKIPQKAISLIVGALK